VDRVNCKVLSPGQHHDERGASGVLVLKFCSTPPCYPVKLSTVVTLNFFFVGHRFAASLVIVLITAGVLSGHGPLHTYGPAPSWILIVMANLAVAVYLISPLVGGYLEPAAPVARPRSRSRWGSVAEFAGTVVSWGLSVALAIFGGGCNWFVWRCLPDINMMP